MHRIICKRTKAKESRIGMHQLKAHQRIIREQRAVEAGQPSQIKTGDQITFGFNFPTPDDMKIKDAEVRPCTFNQARSVIMEYEWLGSMAQRTTHTFALWVGDNDIAGVVCFAIPPTPQAAEGVAGKENAHLVKTLARGACVWWAHPHSASKLIAGAIKLMAETSSFRYFVAYSDYRAGEIGTVYQATNWLYTGTTAGDTEYLIEGEWKSGRTARHKSYVRRGIDYKTLPSRRGNKKHRYVYIAGSRRERKELTKALKYKIADYPKREM